MNNTKGLRESQQVSLGVPNGQQLGNLLSQNDVQHRHNDKCGSDRDHVVRPAAGGRSGMDQAQKLRDGTSASQPTAKLATVMPICVARDSH